LGLVEKIIRIPSEFNALPIQAGFSLLIQRRARKTDKLQERTKEIVRCYENNKFQKVSLDENRQFILVPPRKASIRRRRELIEASQKCIDVLVSLKRLGPTAYTYYDATKKALERGVKIRLIIEKPKKKYEIPKIIEDLQKKPYFLTKYINNFPAAIVSIYDREQILVTTSATKSWGESPTFWSKNPSLLAMINNFYEALWRQQ
jgi:hypothetical protein